VNAPATEAPAVVQEARVPPPTSFNLNKEVVAYHNAKPVGPRTHGIHPSGLAMLCPVKFAIYEQEREKLATAHTQSAFEEILGAEPHGASPGSRFRGQLLMEFRAGHDIHRNVQFDLGVIGKLWGRWLCPWCDAKTPEPGFMPRAWWPGSSGHPTIHAAPCVWCKGRNLRMDVPWVYIEPAVRNAHYGIIGHYDGDVRVVRGDAMWRCLLEIKSINENGFMEKYCTLPKPEHVVQASIYAWLAGFSWILFVYVCKNQLNKWKEIIVPVDVPAVTAVVDKLEAIKTFRETRKLPLHARTCEDIMCAQSRGCPVAETCWGRPVPRSF
jgi:hypothetical protein